jgi:hypothetical protein
MDQGESADEGLTSFALATARLLLAQAQTAGFERGTEVDVR